MPRKLSHIAPDWWDYTTLDSALINDAAKLSERDLRQLSRPGFKVVMYDTLEDFYLAEALEYIHAWRQATADNPVGICGPIGPTEQLPLVARLVNELGLSLKHAHFWGMADPLTPRPRSTSRANSARPPQKQFPSSQLFCPHWQHRAAAAVVYRESWFCGSEHLHSSLSQGHGTDPGSLPRVENPSAQRFCRFHPNSAQCLEEIADGFDT